MNRLLLLLALLLFPTLAHADWTDGGLEQAGNTSGNGDMISVGNTLIFWNGTLGIVRSTDNGATWTDVDPADNNGQNGSVARFAASNGRIWAARSYGSGQGMLTVSTDDGLTWKPDTVGSQPHALGWGGYAVISDMYSWDGYLYIKWDAPDAYDIRKPDGTYTRPAYWKDNDPHAVVAKGSTLYSVSNGLSYTTDYGVSWQKPANNGFKSATALIADGERLYIVGAEGFNQPQHLWFSDDNGENWTKIDAGVVTSRTGLGGTLTNITAYFAKGENIYLGTQPVQFYNSRPNVFRSTNGGVTWFADTNGLGVPYYSSVVGFNYHTDGQIWVIPGLDGIYKQKLDDGGSGPTVLPGAAKLDSPITGSVLQDQAVRFVWGTIASATKYHLQVSFFADFQETIISDETITDTFKSLTLTPGRTYYWRVRGYAPDRIKPKGGGRVQKLSNWSTGYFSISTNRGGWEKLTATGITDMVVFNDAIYLATENGLIKSTDQAMTWTAISTTALDTLTVDKLFVAGDRLYARAYNPFASRAFFGYTTNDGAMWIWDTVGLGEAAQLVDRVAYTNGHMIVNASNTFSYSVRSFSDPTWKALEMYNVFGFTSLGNTFYGYRNGEYIRSTDGGTTWTAFTGPQHCGVVDCIRFMYGENDRLYIMTQKDVYGDTLTLFYSDDNAATWEEISIGEYGTINTTGGPTGVSSIITRGDTIYLSMNYDDDFDYVLRSFDGGTTFEVDTAGAWEKFVGARFTKMYEYKGSIYSVSEGTFQTLGSLYRKRLEPQKESPSLGAPTLLTPEQDQMMPNKNFSYTWTPVEGATSYQIQMSYLQDLSMLMINDSTVTSTSYTNTLGGFAPDYYFRVRARNGDQIGPWSSLRHFSIMLETVQRDEASAKVIAIYPNPAIDIVTLRAIDMHIEHVVVTDALGRQLQLVSGDATNMLSVNVSALTTGAYNLQIVMTDGSQYSRKLIIQ